MNIHFKIRVEVEVRVLELEVEHKLGWSADRRGPTSWVGGCDFKALSLAIEVPLLEVPVFARLVFPSRFVLLAFFA